MQRNGKRQLHPADWRFSGWLLQKKLGFHKRPSRKGGLRDGRITEAKKQKMLES
jgi:hypothetical protein